MAVNNEYIIDIQEQLRKVKAENKRLKKQIKSQETKLEAYEENTVWLGNGDKLVADIYAHDESWAGVGIFLPDNGKTYKIGESDNKKDILINDSNPLILIKSENPDSLQVIIDELQESIKRLEKNDPKFKLIKRIRKYLLSS